MGKVAEEGREMGAITQDGKRHNSSGLHFYQVFYIFSLNQVVKAERDSKGIGDIDYMATEVLSFSKS